MHPYIENIRKDNGTVILCPTQEDWDYVTELFGLKWSSGRWSQYDSDTHIRPCSNLHGEACTRGNPETTIITVDQLKTALLEGEQYNILIFN